MTQSIASAADAILAYTVGRAGGAPGVVAMATDRSANFYEGAAGVRELGKPQPMTADRADRKRIGNIKDMVDRGNGCRGV